jgi:hypothetical protein
VTSAVVLASLVKQLLGLMNARWMSVHEVDVRLSFGKRVPLGRLREIYLVTPLFDGARLIGAKQVECRYL